MKIINKKKTFSIVMLMLVTVGFVFSQTGTSGSSFQKAGSSGAQFLKIGVGSRAMGMGGAFGGLSDDITAIYYNPAGIARLGGTNLGVEYNEWFADMKHTFVGLSLPITSDYTVGISLVMLDAGSIEITTIEEPEGTGSSYSVTDVAVGLTFAGNVTDQFSFGITMKYIENNIFDLTASNFAFDAGTIYESPIPGLKLGFAVSNLGGESEFKGQSLTVLYTNLSERDAGIVARPLNASLNNTPFSIPLSFRGGISYNLFSGSEDNSLIVAGDFIHLSDNPEKFNLGTEYVWNKLFAVRAGYQMRYNEFGLTLGGGINFDNESFRGSFDYAYADLGILGYANRIGFRFKF